MNFDQYKILALKWAREQALKDPTYEFGATRLARIIEEPNEKGLVVCGWG
jgi:hypothetical protein